MALAIPATCLGGSTDHGHPDEHFELFWLWQAKPAVNASWVHRRDGFSLDIGLDVYAGQC